MYLLIALCKVSALSSSRELFLRMSGVTNAFIAAMRICLLALSKCDLERAFIEENSFVLCLSVRLYWINVDRSG